MSENTQKDGGQAFPCCMPSTERHDYLWDGGMSLRDWFAGMALQGNLVSFSDTNCPVPTPQAFAAAAYQQADAMLAERNKPKEDEAKAI